MNKLDADCAQAPKTVGACLEISKKYKIPPMFVPIALDYDERGALEMHDLASPALSNLTRKCADLFETDIAEYLTRRGIKFKSEFQLRQINSQFTPDFLLDTPHAVSEIFGDNCPHILYNDEKIKWIDAKNYPMFGLRLTHEKLLKQAKKYNNEFGPGAYVFAKGVMSPDSRLEMPDAAIVDGTSLRGSSASCSETINCAKLPSLA
jgi:hypothetical protein